MIYFQTATVTDVHDIAYLHADSWQKNYRGDFEDDYLDGPVFAERLKVWQERFTHDDPSRYILLVKNEDKLCGFVCLFIDKDQKHGTLLDNIHVSSDFKGQGIGKKLMQKARQYIQSNAKSNTYFLYVLESNAAAIAFYKKTGGKENGSEIYANPGGGRSKVLRFVWILDSRT